VKDPAKLKLGGEKREMTVFFLDIAHFTSISEKLDPERLTQFLNVYLSTITDIILKNDGVVDKYIGDCVMAFWNAPLDLPEHRLKGCLSAVECIAAVERLNEKGFAGLPEKPAVRIGLNSGKMVVGNMGSSTRLSYTVISDEVNLASRLEGANKYFGSRVMASEATYAGAKDKVEARELGMLRVVGKAVPVRVYELMGKKGELTSSARGLLERYAEGFDLFYKRDFAGAQLAFRAALEIAPEDAPSKLYLRLCGDYLKEPPVKEWDGVFNLTSK
jgi:adenylate cyclase